MHLIINFDMKYLCLIKKFGICWYCYFFIEIHLTRALGRVTYAFSMVIFTHIIFYDKNKK